MFAVKKDVRSEIGMSGGGGRRGGEGGGLRQVLPEAVQVVRPPPLVLAHWSLEVEPAGEKAPRTGQSKQWS